MRKLVYLLFSVAVAMIGFQIHKDLFWSFIDFFIPVLVLIKWLIYHEINARIISETFSFFYK